MEYARLVDGPHRGVADALAGRARGIAVATSGSTGEPRNVRLSADAVVASATRSLERLGGPGHWLLALPADRIAGAMVLARAGIGGGQVVELPPGPFTPAGFADAVAALPAGRVYVSLVPTQVARLMADERGREALARFAAVLVGGASPGAAMPPNAVETYGMSETCGGCVYDGEPLADVRIAIDGDGRVVLGGPMLADGYADGDDEAFRGSGAARTFTTSDLGVLIDGRLTMLGRADDVIISGGQNVHPAVVERALCALDEIADAVVVGVADEEWGERVVALAVAPAGREVPDVDALREQLDLPRHALPRARYVVGTLPMTKAGKIDRATARAIAVDAER